MKYSCYFHKLIKYVFTSTSFIIIYWFVIHTNIICVYDFLLLLFFHIFHIRHVNLRLDYIENVCVCLRLYKKNLIKYRSFTVIVLARNEMTQHRNMGNDDDQWWWRMKLQMWKTWKSWNRSLLCWCFFFIVSISKRCRYIELKNSLRYVNNNNAVLEINF